MVRYGKPYAPTKIKDFEILPDVRLLLDQLKQSGYFLVVVTNQPDVGNKITKQETVESMHAILLNELPLDEIKVCYCKQTDQCECRKPKPGMLIEAALEFNLDLINSYMIGDRRSDIEAGAAAGCRTVFIDRGYRYSEHPKKVDKKTMNLQEAVEYILEKN